MKEKVSKKMVFVVQKSLFNEFKTACEAEYKTMSEVIRHSMLQYIKEHKSERTNNQKYYKGKKQ